MSDSITQEHRSWNMSRIRNKDTKIEVIVRKYLFSKGYRFRKNDKRYPGKPDIVLPKYHVVIFVNGCFWHQHPGCKNATMPKSNTEFWQKKLERNVSNDVNNIKILSEMGWHVITLWECELEKDFEGCMERVLTEIKHVFWEKSKWQSKISTKK